MSQIRGSAHVLSLLRCLILSWNFFTGCCITVAFSSPLLEPLPQAKDPQTWFLRDKRERVSFFSWKVQLDFASKDPIAGYGATSDVTGRGTHLRSRGTVCWTLV